MNIRTTRLNNGTVVLAKPDGSAVQYISQTQAANKLTDLVMAGIDAYPVPSSNRRGIFIAINGK